MSHGPVFEFDPDFYTGALTTPLEHLQRVRYNNDDRAPLTHLSLDQVDLFYQHLPALLSAFRRPDLTVQVKLARGDMVVVDNHRVMHGRTPFHGASKRKLVGCYAEMSESAQHGLAKHRRGTATQAHAHIHTQAHQHHHHLPHDVGAQARPYSSLASTREQEGSLVNVSSVVQREDEESVAVSWSDGHVMEVNACWVRHNCICALCKEEHSGQKTIPHSAIDGVCNIEKLSYDKAGDALHVRFCADGHDAVVSREQLFDARVAAQKLVCSLPRRPDTRSQPWADSYLPLPSMTHQEVMASEHGQWQWLDHLRYASLGPPCGSLLRTARPMPPSQGVPLFLFVTCSRDYGRSLCLTCRVGFRAPLGTAGCAALTALALNRVWSRS